MLLAAGTKGKRFALPNARILIHQPSGAGERPVAATSRSRPARSCGCARCSSRCWPTTPASTEEQVRKDIERDKILTAAEAVDYGLIDEVSEVAQDICATRGGLSRR